MQTEKRLRMLIAMVDWHRRWNPTWTLTIQQGTEAVRESAGLDDTYLDIQPPNSTFVKRTSLIAKRRWPPCQDMYLTQNKSCSSPTNPLALHAFKNPHTFHSKIYPTLRSGLVNLCYHTLIQQFRLI